MLPVVGDRTEPNVPGRRAGFHGDRIEYRSRVDRPVIFVAAQTLPSAFNMRCAQKTPCQRTMFLFFMAYMASSAAWMIVSGSPSMLMLMPTLADPG